MRIFAHGLLLASAASSALAADIDNSWLRGSSSFPADPPAYRRWNGIYGGGQVGLDFHSIQFSDNGNATVATLVGLNPILTAAGASTLGDLARSNASGLSYGGFVGYNYQIDDTVLGLELNLNGSGVNVGASGSAWKSASPVVAGNTYQLNVLTSNAVTGTLADYGTARVRGGWAYGSFLPYVVAGLAVGRIDYVQTTNVSYSGTITAGPGVGQNVNQSFTAAAVNHGKAAVGFSAGLGFDYAVYQNVFLRGEVEYLQFGTIGSVNLNATSMRSGVGVKF